MKDATRFLQALIAAYAPDPALRLEIRPLWPEWKEAELYPDGEPPWWWRSRTGMRQWYPLCAADAAAHHAQRAAERADVYMGALPRLGRKGGREDVKMAAWLWADVDGGEAGPEGSIALVKASGLPAPHLAVMSGGGVHVYWRLMEVETLPDAAARDEFKEMLRRVVRAIGGTSSGAHADSSRADTASILRVPDTYNWKQREQPREVRLLRCQMEQEAHSLTWWSARLPAMPLPSCERDARPLLPGETRPLPPKALRILETRWLPGTRHHALRDLLAIARGVCGFDAPALEMLAEAFAAQNAGRREWALNLARDTYRRIHPN
jgi:hypothetical protein